MRVLVNKDDSTDSQAKRSVLQDIVDEQQGEEKFGLCRFKYGFCIGNLMFKFDHWHRD